MVCLQPGPGLPGVEGVVDPPIAVSLTVFPRRLAKSVDPFNLIEVYDFIFKNRHDLEYEFESRRMMNLLPGYQFLPI
jgi:hypothetical protein